jgi:FkbH-like protein
MWDIENSSLKSAQSIWRSSLESPKKNQVILIFEEHCTECSIPDCYTTCLLYSPREDNSCRRFEKGIFFNNEVCGYEISFKRWAKLEGQILGVSSSPIKLRIIESIYQLILGIIGWHLTKRTRLDWRERSKRWFKKILGDRLSPLRQGRINVRLRISNPNGSVTANLQYANSRGIHSMHNLSIPPGLSVHVVSLGTITEDDLNNNSHFITFTPQADQSLSLIFHEFTPYIEEDQVKIPSILEYEDLVKVPDNQKNVKCVIWDLDNTLWNGILTEDGINGITLKKDIKEIISTLDSRGILQSVSSKNDYDLAIEALSSFGLREYFLAPEINWNQKSSSIESIAKKLNLSVDSFVFVDDSEFERQEVNSRFPSIRTFGYLTLEQLSSDSTLIPIVTEEARNRRKMYLADFKRKEEQVSYGENYLSYLRDCEIVLSLRNLSPNSDLNRGFELLSRTNQLNLSGKKFTLEEFSEDLLNVNSHWFIGNVLDKYGDYGSVIIFRLEINNQENTKLVITDLAISCRVAERLIEPALIQALFTRFKKNGNIQISVRYVSTGRNTPIRNALTNLGYNVDDELPTIFASSRFSNGDIVQVNWDN